MTYSFFGRRDFELGKKLDYNKQIVRRVYRAWMLTSKLDLDVAKLIMRATNRIEEKETIGLLLKTFEDELKRTKSTMVVTFLRLELLGPKYLYISSDGAMDDDGVGGGVVVGGACAIGWPPCLGASGWTLFVPQTALGRERCQDDSSH